MTPEEIGLEVDGLDFGGIDPSVTEPALGGVDIMGALGPVLALVQIVTLAILVVAIVSMWKIFKKAGKPGWAALIPIYNTVVMVKVAKAPMWYLVPILGGIVLGFIPVIGTFIAIAAVVFSFILNVKLAKAFGKSAGFGIGITLLPIIFLPILAFGKAQYIGAASAPATPAPQMPQAPSQVPPESIPPQVPPVAPIQ